MYDKNHAISIFWIILFNIVELKHFYTHSDVSEDTIDHGKKLMSVLFFTFRFLETLLWKLLLLYFLTELGIACFICIMNHCIDWINISYMVIWFALNKGANDIMIGFLDLLVFWSISL